MEKQKRLGTLRRAQTIFFKALLAGYAGNAEKKDPRLATVTSMFGFEKTNIYRYGEFTVIDRWVTSDHSDVSFGTTTILFEEVPIWFMTYSGLYPKESISFLKEVLSVQYKKRFFRGGRGPIRWTSEHGRFIYKNHAHKTGNLDFSHFSGREEILDKKTGKVLGFHEYSGMRMI